MTTLGLREQRMVRTLGEELAPIADAELRKLRARALDLPAMLRRHGPLQVLLFLRTKEGSDRRLAELLLAGVAAALGGSGPDLGSGGLEGFLDELAALDLQPYYLRWEAAVEAASWLKRLVEARLGWETSPPTESTPS